VLQIARSIYSMRRPRRSDSSLHFRRSGAARLLGHGIGGDARAHHRDARAAGDHLAEATQSAEFEFIRSQHGMFSLLGVSPALVGSLRDRHHIYMTSDSRMNLAGIMPHNAAYVARSVAAVRSDAVAEGRTGPDPDLGPARHADGSTGPRRRARC